MDLLKNGARPEEIAIAEQRAEMARVQMEFAQSELTRANELLETSAASAKEADKAKREYDLAERMLAAAEENLERVKSGAREEEIRAAAAEVTRIEA